MSDRRLELITGSKRPHARSARVKAAIVAETFAPGANLSQIARRHGLNRGLLFTWRRQVRRALAGPVAEAASEGGRVPTFVPVEIEDVVYALRGGTDLRGGRLCQDCEPLSSG